MSIYEEMVAHVKTVKELFPDEEKRLSKVYKAYRVKRTADNEPIDYTEETFKAKCREDDEFCFFYTAYTNPWVNW